MEDRPPRPGRALALRALLASLLAVLVVGGGVAAIGFNEIDRIGKAHERGQERGGQQDIDSKETDLPKPGEPQTLLVLGTDERRGADRSQREDARSDTIVLARLDADAGVISLMSIPRDLKVEVPGQPAPDKINSAFTRGGADGTARAVKRLLSRPGEPFEINHIVQVSFSGFREVVDYLGCSWVDVDRRYFNDQGGPGGYATIDIQPGYQRLCGADALDYVRYRHTDNDLVRSARQQDFVRQLLDQPGVRSRLSWDNREALAELAGEHTSTDEGLTGKGLMTFAKLALNLEGAPVVQVPFGDGRLADDGAFLTAPDDAVAATVRRFLHPRTRTGTSAAKPRRRDTPARKRPATDGLVDARAAGEAQAIAQGASLGFDFAYPARIPAGGTLEAPRRYSIRTGKDEVHRAYRTVIDTGVIGQSLGVQGTTWTDPPALSGPHDKITVDGRRLEVFWDGKAVRLVAWKTAGAVYWVSNSLTRSVPYSRMVATARSLTRLR